jgi:aryl-alcohol dehydrogenase-like predicted oxidoreductase
MRCGNAVRRALGDQYGTPAQTALRFVLGNRDIHSRVIGMSELAQIDEALEAVRQGPLPSAALSKLDQLWAHDFQAP